MTVYDCCMFLNENDLYEIRLKTHWNFVDKFIVIEAGETHTGDPKPFNFDQERFKKYADKLIYVKFDNFQDEINKYADLLLDEDCVRDRGPNMETDDWIRDHFQANYLYKILLDLRADDKDIVFISCLDELIKESAFYQALERFKGDETYNGIRPVFSFHCNLYVYKFNLLHKHWTDHLAGMITEFGNFKKILPTTLRDRSISTHPHIENGGFHFTFLDNTDGEKVLTKQKSWAHSRDVYHGQKIKYDNQSVDEALERLFRDYPNKLVDITEETHPKYIVDNLSEYSQYIYEPLLNNIDYCAACGNRNLIKFPATMDNWTLKRFLRLNPYTEKPQAYIHHCQDCDYAGISYRFNQKSERSYYRDYMTGEYLSSRAQVEGPSIIEYSKWYHSSDNVNQCKQQREKLLKQVIDTDQIKSVLDFGGDTGIMIPDCFNHAEKYIHEIETRNFETDIKIVEAYQKVDLILCLHTLEHVSDIENFMKQLQSHLDLNSFLYIEVPKEYSKHFAGPYNFYEHINLFTETALHNLLQLYGFTIIGVETIEYIEPMTTSIGAIAQFRGVKE